MLWIILLITIIVLSFWFKRWKNTKLIKLANQLKAKSRCLPFVGHSYMMLGDDEDRMSTFIRIGEEALEKGGLVSHWQGNKLFIMVADPEAAEVILKTCLEKGDTIKFLRALIDNGSIFAPVQVWRPRRKLLAPIFSQKNLNAFVKIFAKQSTVMVEQLQSLVAKGNFSIWKYLAGYTMDSVSETTLGITVNAQQQPENPFLCAFDACCRIDTARVCQPWLQNETIYNFLPCSKEHAKCKKIIWDYINRIIAPKWREMKTGNKTNEIHAQKNGLKNFLELLIESSKNGREFTGLELREETLVIVLAGTDTSAVGTAFTILMLANHPEVQDKVYQELYEIFGDSDRQVEAEDLPKLKYMEAVIKETLRLYPPVPFIIRKVEKDLLLPSGITLAEGCGIFISIWSIHRNPKYWGHDADAFKPERFIDSSPSHPAAFMAFSYGPRGCLGYQYALMSMKSALATLLRRYRILQASSSSKGVIDHSEERKDKKLRLKFTVMMKDVDNFVIQLENRK